MSENDRYKIKKLAGAGVDGMEDEPPIWHFELWAEDVHEFVTKPVRFLERIGVDSNDIAPDGRLSVTFLLQDEPTRLPPMCFCVAATDGGTVVTAWSHC